MRALQLRRAGLADPAALPLLAGPRAREQPAEARARAHPAHPAFTSIHYAEPGYGQLASTCPRQIRTGAADGGEMGAFNQLEQPQREANLRLRLEEYMPFGLEPGVIHVT